MSKRISIRDIAERVGVAASTVSLILNGRSDELRISRQLTQKVSQVAIDLNYIPNPVAISLRTGKSKIVCLIVENISNPFFSTLTFLIEERLRLSGYQLVCSSTSNDSANTTALIKKLSNGLVDGFLITPISGLEDDVYMLVKNKIPVVLIDSYYPKIDIPHVLVDNKFGIEQGMKELLKAGCTNILFISVNINMIQIQQRDAAYETVMIKNGLKPLILKLDYHEDHQIAVAKISQMIKNIEPDGIFFATNYLGLSGIQSLAKLNKKIGDDIKVVCFDDHDLFKFMKPAITVVQQPIATIANTAVDILLNKMVHKKNIKMQELLIKPVLQKRASV